MHDITALLARSCAGHSPTLAKTLNQPWALGGLVTGLIPLCGSYDHGHVFGNIITIHQQWGVWFIVASLTVVGVVAEGFCVAIAQLASRSKLRAALLGLAPESSSTPPNSTAQG